MTEPTMAQRAAALMAELDERLTVGHETTCSGCGGTIVRTTPPATSLASDALRFGQPDYAHPGWLRCPGRPADESLRIERGRA